MPYNGGMEVVINGKREVHPDGISIAALLESLELGGQACAVEVNKVLIPKQRHKTHRIEDGDRIELMTLVGGG